MNGKIRRFLAAALLLLMGACACAEGVPTPTPSLEPTPVAAPSPAPMLPAVVPAKGNAALVEGAQKVPQFYDLPTPTPSPEPTPVAAPSPAPMLPAVVPAEGNAALVEGAQKVPEFYEIPTPVPTPTPEPTPEPTPTPEPEAGALEMDWWESDIQNIFAVDVEATITDVKRGISWQVVRTRGTNHADVQPCSITDTREMKRACRDWSWKRRAIWVTIDGVTYAASMNSMPHGGGIGAHNEFPGHFCIHFTNSKTHGSEKVDKNHQKMVKAAYDAALE